MPVVYPFLLILFSHGHLHRGGRAEGYKELDEEETVESQTSGTSAAQYSIQNGGVAASGEHPYGEHPSRTLFVRNINSNVEDMELRALFEVHSLSRSLSSIVVYGVYVLDCLSHI